MPITGPNDTPNPFAVPHLVLKHPMMPPPIPPPGFYPSSDTVSTSRVDKIPEKEKDTSQQSSLIANDEVADDEIDRSEDGPVGPPPSEWLPHKALPSPEVFRDASLLDSSKWEPWFAIVRKYLDQFELGHE